VFAPATIVAYDTPLYHHVGRNSAKDAHADLISVVLELAQTISEIGKRIASPMKIRNFTAASAAGKKAGTFRVFRGAFPDEDPRGLHPARSRPPPIPVERSEAPVVSRRFPALMLPFMPRFLLAVFLLPFAASASLPFDTVFKGRSKFDALVARADIWKGLPINERVAAVGQALVGTPYKSYTLEIDDRVEAPSVNLAGLDCWTFFETSLAFARMLDEPRDQWTPQTMLKYIERDRYRGGSCDGSYLSRLHYLEEWLHDNAQRGLVQDLTRTLGGASVSHSADEMTINWRSYRYMRNSPEVRAGIRVMEQRVGSLPMTHIPKSKVPGIEPKLQSGDIIGITTKDRGGVGTAHVGLALRTADGVLHFMHASSPSNYGKVVIDTRLSDYLTRYRSDLGIMVARPLK
jgi:hypothetical protein